MQYLIIEQSKVIDNEKGPICSFCYGGWSSTHVVPTATEFMKIAIIPAIVNQAVPKMTAPVQSPTLFMLRIYSQAMICRLK